jgi:hypothetical protein
MVSNIPQVPEMTQAERVAVSLAAIRTHESRSLTEKFSIIDRALKERTIVAALGVILAGCIACGGAAVEPEPVPAPPEPAAWCGYDFEQAVEVFEGERVCQTTVYDLETGYCTFWEPCPAR